MKWNFPQKTFKFIIDLLYVSFQTVTIISCWSSIWFCGAKLYWCLLSGIIELHLTANTYQCAAVDYAPLTQATRGQAQFCYDIATLLPVYNPIATLVVANSSSMAGNAISTVAVFGSAYGKESQAPFFSCPLFLVYRILFLIIRIFDNASTRPLLIQNIQKMTDYVASQYHWTFGIQVLDKLFLHEEWKLNAVLKIMTTLLRTKV